MVLTMHVHSLEPEIFFGQFNPSCDEFGGVLECGSQENMNDVVPVFGVKREEGSWIESGRNKFSIEKPGEHRMVCKPTKITFTTKTPNLKVGYPYFISLNIAIFS
jgi:hypothetical protein